MAMVTQSISAGVPAGRRATAAAEVAARTKRNMKGFIGDIEDRTDDNGHFRRVIYTGAHMQLVLMSLQPGEDIGLETHQDTDQFFRVAEGTGVVSIDGNEAPIASDSGIVVPARARHNVKNTGPKPMKLYTIYAPPHHEDGTVHHTKTDAEHSTEHFAGKTTE